MKSKKKLGKVAIFGVGLIGGSLGLALKKKGLAREVAGIGRRSSSIRKAVGREAVDWGTLSVTKGVKGAELVVLAVPVGLIAEKGVEAAAKMDEGAVLTDVGSVKGAAMRELERNLPAVRRARVEFVGGHPIAGSEKSGVEAASAELFDGSVCVLTPGKASSRRALRLVSEMWRSVGCRVVKMSAREHDRLLGEVSHLPHAVASALVQAISEEALEYGAGGFGDTTRIAGGSARLWADILIANRREILRAMGRFEKDLAHLRSAIEKGDRDMVMRLLEETKAKRELFENRRSRKMKRRR